MIESEWQLRVVQHLNRVGTPWRFWRQNSGRFRIVDRKGGSQRWVRGAPKGAGDLVGIARPDGLLCEIELKTKTGRTAEHQKMRGEFVRSFGGVYIEARHNPAESIDENLDRIETMLAAAIEYARGDYARRAAITLPGRIETLTIDITT